MTTKNKRIVAWSLLGLAIPVMLIMDGDTVRHSCGLVALGAFVMMATVKR